MIARCTRYYRHNSEKTVLAKGDFVVAKLPEHRGMITIMSLFHDNLITVSQQVFDKHFVFDEMNTRIDEWLLNVKWKTPSQPMALDVRRHNLLLQQSEIK